MNIIGELIIKAGTQNIDNNSMVETVANITNSIRPKYMYLFVLDIAIEFIFIFG